jgi:hypothetical protein
MIAMRCSSIAVLAAAIFAGPASAQLFNLQPTRPTLDRWMYNFNSTFPVGSETAFSTFAITNDTRFDDRDAEILLGFDTAPIPAARPLETYRLISAAVTVRIQNDLAFRYDPSFDALATYFPIADPEHVPDADPGRPIELYLAAYRNGWAATGLASPPRFDETSPYGSLPPFTVQNRGTRNVFPAQYDPGTGAVVNLENNIDDRIAQRPLALGLASLSPGEFVPRLTDFTFTIDLTNPDARRYLTESIAAGRLNLLISSPLQSFQGDTNIPRFFSKEAVDQGFPGAAAPSLSLRVCVGPPGDWNCDGVKAPADIFLFLNAYFAGDPAADVNYDGSRTPTDIFAFLNAYFAD